ncbi:MAG: TatD family hydrolase [Flavobacteriales bacterium]
MLFIDTHTHLFSPSFDEDRPDVIKRALQAGVEVMLLPNIDIESIGPMYELSAQYPENCFPMMGLHPGSVDADWEKKLEVIRQHLFSKKNFAVGEIGMDLYWDKTFKDQQAEAFRLQISWAKELSLPIVIHAREAFNEIFEIVDDLYDDALTGVFHCFTGTVDQAKKIAEYGGFKLGIGGVLTYKKSGLDEVIKHLSLDIMILETDSPYLPPTPHRGKRNESAYLLHVAEKLAEVKGMTLKEVADATSLNAKSLFKLN